MIKCGFLIFLVALTANNLEDKNYISSHTGEWIVRLFNLLVVIYLIATNRP